MNCQKTQKQVAVEQKGEYNREERIKELNVGKERLDSTNKAQEWKKLKCGLWKSKNNEIAFRTEGGTEEGVEYTYFLTHFEDDKPLKSVIDTNTFQQYPQSFFYKDKHHVYLHYTMASGGRFWVLEEADVKTFKFLGGCYAKDKKRIYTERNIHWEEVDYQTFKTCDKCNCYSKDKNGFYSGDSKINRDEEKDSLAQQAIKRLERL
jgi:hypothetical protein